VLVKRVYAEKHSKVKDYYAIKHKKKTRTTRASKPRGTKGMIMNRFMEFATLRTHLISLGIGPVDALGVALQAVYGWSGSLSDKSEEAQAEKEVGKAIVALFNEMRGMRGGEVESEPEK
jgi:hypothetical protein